VDANAQKHGMLEAASAYLEFLYTPEAQQIIGKNYFRPTDPQVAARFARQFPAIRLVTIDGAFGGWQKAQARHFNDGGTFDEIYAR
jgi:sulfate transport system substrate-binding protein